MYALLREINANEKATVIMVTHDLARVPSLASHILELSGGQKYFGESAGWPGPGKGSGANV